MNIVFKILSAIFAFIIAVSPFGNKTEEPKCKPEFNGTFIQSWLSSSWSDEQWQSEIENMQDAGIEYLILQDVANKAYKSSGGGWSIYYDSDLDVFDGATVYNDVIESALRNCSGTGIKVFVGLAMFDDFWTEGAITGQYAEMCDVASQMVTEIYTKYYSRYSDCFYGWYFTPEFNNVLTCQVNISGMSRGLNKIIDAINSGDADMPLLLSPFFAEYLANTHTGTLVNLVRLLNSVNFRDGDIFAPQDAIGALWTSSKNLDKTWKMYSQAVKACDADLRLWANCENFCIAIAKSPLNGILTRPTTENTAYVTSTLDRFVWQMEVASKYCENIITFSYNHYFSPDQVNSAFINTYLDYVDNGYVLECERPAAVRELSKTQTDVGVLLEWKESTDNFGIAYYRIEKNGKFLARVEMISGDEELVYSDSLGRAEDTYSVTAYDAAGNVSETVTA
ncbi:MAG: DUF4434 domain-containing protein [Clostridia bacterium]|nr:DUF4434 domain-containing protein [Clostridia bacterium]